MLESMGCVLLCLPACTCSTTILWNFWEEECLPFTWSWSLFGCSPPPDAFLEKDDSGGHSTILPFCSVHSVSLYHSTILQPTSSVLLFYLFTVSIDTTCSCSSAVMHYKLPPLVGRCLLHSGTVDLPITTIHRFGRYRLPVQTTGHHSADTWVRWSWSTISRFLEGYHLQIRLGYRAFPFYTCRLPATVCSGGGGHRLPPQDHRYLPFVTCILSTILEVILGHHFISTCSTCHWVGRFHLRFRFWVMRYRYHSW